MADSWGSRLQPVQVSLLGREMVAPAKPTQSQNYYLSCLDIFWQGTHYNRRLIFYESSTGWLPEYGHYFLVRTVPAVDGRRAAVMEKLKSSLALCLEHYYCWCGRIAQGGEPDHRLFIDCNDAGVEFVEAFVDLPISHLANDGYQMKPFFDELCQNPDHTGDCLYSSPLLSIQATFFSDGGLALGIAQSHVVADGHSLWNFMVSWGECSRGIPLSSPPLHMNERLAVPEPSPEKATWTLSLEIKEEDKLEQEEMEDLTVADKGDASIHNHNGSKGTEPATSEDKDNRLGANSTNRDEDINTETDPNRKNSMGTALVGEEKVAPLVQCMFNLPSSAIKELKREAGEGYTSFEVTCAHFWHRVTAAREKPTSDPTYFFFPINSRTRMIPPLPPAYFGNVITFAGILSTVGAIRRETLRATACRIHDAVPKKKEDYLVSFMHWLETHNNSLVSTFSKRPPIGKGLNVASSPWFPAYQVDFGWGKPVAIRTVKVYGDGEIVFFGGRPGSNQGDVEICTALPESVLRRLLEDPALLATAPSSPFASDL